MIYTPLTCKAMQIAYAAHLNQRDKSGVPYIFHPYHVAEQMKDEYSVCAALLHDVVEDTMVTIEQLSEEFPQDVTEAVRILTHDSEMDYMTYVGEIKNNPIARNVKIADLRHNSDITRLEGIEWKEPEENVIARREKYQKALSMLVD